MLPENSKIAQSGYTGYYLNLGRQKFKVPGSIPSDTKYFFALKTREGTVQKRKAKKWIDPEGFISMFFHPSVCFNKCIFTQNCTTISLHRSHLSYLGNYFKFNVQINRLGSFSLNWSKQHYIEPNIIYMLTFSPSRTALIHIPFRY